MKPFTWQSTWDVKACQPMHVAFLHSLVAAVTALCVTTVQAAPEPAFDRSPQPMRATPSPLPAGWQHGAFMEIFVRAYQDSDGDGIGDLKGLISRLDDLQALGIRGLWLMPITASADHDHGYATIDHRAVEPAYGTLDDVDTLLREAHRRGIGVVMDYVVNHASWQHPAFQAAIADPRSPWRDWFVFSQDAPQGWNIWGANPWYWLPSKPWEHGDPKTQPPAPAGAKDHFFGTFGPHMPDFNLRRAEVFEYHLDSLRFWLNRGLDGFRLDAVPHMIENDAVRWNDQPESRALTKRLQDTILAYPNRYVVCEATAEPQAYGDPAVCGGSFAFGYQHHFVQAAQGEAASVAALASYYRSASPRMATFTSSHDIFAGLRLWDQVGGDEARYRLAAAGYLLQPGTPFVYYGEEVGQASLIGLPGDRPVRGSMSWTAEQRTAGFSPKAPYNGRSPNADSHHLAAQRADPNSLWHFYRQLISLRNTRPSLAQGDFAHSQADGLLLSFQRRLGSERSLVLINYGRTSVQARPEGLPAGLPPQLLWRSAPAPAGASAFELAPQSVAVFAIDG